VLLDELCAGTDPSEGAALAMAITEHIRKAGAAAVITTHYNELKEYSMTQEGIENASMDFDPETFAPIFRLKIGVPGASNAIKIAGRLGLSPKIVEAASNSLGQDRLQFESIIASASLALKNAEADREKAERYKQEIKSELEKIKRDSQKLEHEREVFNRDIKRRAKDIAQEAAVEAENIVAELKELVKSGTDAALFEANRLKKKLYAIAETDEQQVKGKNIDTDEYQIIEGELNTGDDVYIKSLQTKGIIETVSGSGITVKIGALKTHVKAGDVQKIKYNNQQEQVKSTVSIAKQFTTEVIPNEINLLGKNVDEAIYLVDLFIDRAVNGGLNEVRIIHGVGAGILYKAIHLHLKGHKNAASYRFGKYGEGEKGVTVVTLK
jgi:DNA mismatch repair protein MutS2